ncbi:MAG TPA: hypothetical protein PKA64_01560 [Myxococcota bacterium]|nr:hypothetical protein [Myxococcota bacterium]
MALGTAKTIIEQAGLPLGSPGTPRRDIVIGVPVVIRNASDSNVTSHRWRFVAKPNNSAAFIADPVAPTCVFTPDVVGTWIVELQVNEGVPPNQIFRTIVAVEDPITGWRFPSFAEESESNGWVSPNTGSPNKQGWADDLLHVLSDILNFVQPTLQSYVTVNNDTASLPNSRRLVQAADVVISDGGAGNPVTFSTAYLIGVRRTQDVALQPENVRAVRTVEAPTIGAGFSGQVNLGSQTGVLYGTAANYATIGGGGDNIASGTYSTVAGGHQATASGGNSTVGGGESNAATGDLSTVAGGEGNTASGSRSAVCGGSTNTASGDYTGILSGRGNDVLEFYGAVAGGRDNTCDGTASFIGGGQNNATGSNQNAIGGGSGNTTAGSNSGVFVGENNQTFALDAAVVTGDSNNAAGNYGGILSGANNTVLGIYAAVVTGSINTASGQSSGVLCGANHIASGTNAAVVYGTDCTASATNTLAGGNTSAASAANSIALGTQCFASHSGSMVLGDAQATSKGSSVANEATLYFGGGIRLLNSPVEMRQHTGFTGAGLFFRTGAARTTNATTHSVTLYAAVEDRMINCRGVILGKQDASVNARSFAFNRSFIRQGGAVTALTAHQSDAQVNGAAAWTTAITNSGTNIVLQFAGAVGTTIDWAWNVQFQVGGEGS